MDSERDIFVDKYISYLCEVQHVSKIKQFKGYFYELLLYIHENATKHNMSTVSHKIKNNCLFVNKIFDNDFVFFDHCDEYNMYVRYITVYCPDEIQNDTMQGHTQQEKYYGCDFQCQTTFKLIVTKLKTLTEYSKESLLKQQDELEKLKSNIDLEEFNLKQKKFKQSLITAKNICGFINAVKVIC